MQSATNSVDKQTITEASMPSGDALPGAFLELKKQLDQSSELVTKKSQVIRLHEARIKVLEEQLRLNKIERFGASSEKGSPQYNFFNDAELLGDQADAAAEEAAAKAGQEYYQCVVIGLYHHLQILRWTPLVPP